MTVPSATALVERHLADALGRPAARASVTFLGTDRIEVLRFGPAPVRYSTLGLSARPMADPLAPVADPVRGPRAELLLTLREPRDELLRPLAVLAAAPEVEGVVLAPGAVLDLGIPLWPSAPFHSVLLGGPDPSLPDCALPPPADPVRFIPVLPMTEPEAAFRRARGTEALQSRWVSCGTDLTDPLRGSVRFG